MANALQTTDLATVWTIVIQESNDKADVPFTVTYADYCDLSASTDIIDMVTTVLVSATPQSVIKQNTCGIQTYSLVQDSKPATGSVDPNISFDSTTMKINVNPVSNLSVGAYIYTFTVYDSLKLPRNTESQTFTITIDPCVITAYILDVIGA